MYWTHCQHHHYYLSASKFLCSFANLCFIIIVMKVLETQHKLFILLGVCAHIKRKLRWVGHCPSHLLLPLSENRIQCLNLTSWALACFILVVVQVGNKQKLDVIISEIL